MIAKDIYDKALITLGYTDDQVFKDRAVVVINQVYDDLSEITGVEHTPIKNLSSEVNLPDRICNNAMVFGVAEKLALGQGDGEQQQYYAIKYDQARMKLSHSDKVVTVI
jgi:hypothetical protein